MWCNARAASVVLASERAQAAQYDQGMPMTLAGADFSEGRPARNALACEGKGDTEEAEECAISKTP